MTSIPNPINRIMQRDPLPEKVDRMLRNPVVLLTVGGVAAGASLIGVVLLEITLRIISGSGLIGWSQYLLADPLWFALIVGFVALNVIVNGCAICILLERKFASYIQDRLGPNRVGFWGLLQPLADGLKFLLKEDIVPARVDKPVFILAPGIAFAVALLGFAVIPWGGQVKWPWMPADAAPLHSALATIDIGFLYMLATASLGVYGVVLAGWSSNNKYAFYGGMRATAQMLSYEVPLGLGLLCIMLVAGSLRLDLIIDQQASSGVWNVFLQPVAFILVLISAFAETNRTPFDLVEAEQELVGGYHTEYSSMKFALFFLAEYAHMITNSALMVALFFGGWHFWGLPGPENTTWWAFLLKFSVFWAKVGAFVVFYMVIRWTLPRFRFDQLMRLAWQSLIPTGMVVFVGTAFLVAYGAGRSIYWSVCMNVLTVIVLLVLSGINRKPLTGRQENLPDVAVLPGR